MSTTPTLSTISTYINGQQGSASQFMADLTALYNVGQENLTTLNNLRTATVIELQRRLSYLNSKQQESNKLLGKNVLVNFSLANFLNLDQSETTATVRVDTTVATAMEKDVEVEAVIKSINFTTTVGSVETLNAQSNTYRVYNTNNKVPTGTFNIALRSPINLSVLVFDLPSIASNPTITVEVSNTNVTYTPCISYSLNGYRLIVYLAPSEIQYIKLSITPSQADNLGGTLYTFGITDFIGSSVQYQLLSEVVTKPSAFTPYSLNCQLVGNQYDGLLYFLSLAGQGYVEVNLNTPIAIPGVSSVNTTGVSLDGTGLLSSTLNSTAYLNTLKVIDLSTNQPVPLLYGLSHTFSTISNLAKSYISVVGNNLYYVPYVSGDSTKTFSISYLEGPSSVTVQLKVQIATNDKNTSPIFNGVVLAIA